MHYMELGGAESALLGLLQSVDPSRVDIDLFIYAHRGELMEFIPKEKVHLLPQNEAYSLTEEPISLLIKKRYWRLAIARLIGREKYKLFQKFNKEGKEDVSAMTYQQYQTVKVLPPINPNVEYDLAISFLSPHYICAQKVRAKHKVAWIHTDYTNVYINSEMELRMWQVYDKIASISPDVTEKYSEVFPSLTHKIILIENILSTAYIHKRSEVPCQVFEQDPSIKLLSIGRYSYAKKMEDIPYLCKRLVCSEELGARNVRWYIIGYGSAEIEQQVREEIVKEGMQEHVILLGKQSNPYPYIRTCDVYVQPSRYEGKSITVREAQILCKPVVVTHYPTASSQILDGVDGVIVPLEREACAEGMIRFLQDKVLQERITEHLRTHDYGNEVEIEKIYRLCE